MHTQGLYPFFFSLLMLAILNSCFTTKAPTTTRDTSKVGNYPTAAGANNSFILKDSPSNLVGGAELTIDIDLNQYLDLTPELITTGDYLLSDITIIDPMTEQSLRLGNVSFQVQQTELSSKTGKNNGSWAYDANSDAFLEVNTFWHARRFLQNFQTALKLGASLGQTWNFDSSSYYYHASIPSNVFSTQSNWRKDRQFSIYTKGLNFFNAAFYAADFNLKVGFDENLKGRYLPYFNLCTDPTIIYHELGHTAVHILMNLRNFSASNDVMSQLGNFFYDEAGAINEGLADYFSFVLSSNTHFAKWGLGQFYGASRPITDDDGLHIHGIGSSEQRVSYPDFLTYDPNFPGEIVEDIHNAGMITSHYLVALTQDLMSACSMDHETATQNVMILLAETMAELGDLTTRGSDLNMSTDSFTNLNKDHAKQWMSSANPINYRRFFMTFARKLLESSKMWFGEDLCNTYDQNRIEQLMDDYGLLLFRSYNEDGGMDSPFGVYGSPYDDQTINTQVNSLNRLKSVLIKKEFIDLDKRTGATQIYVFDQQGPIKNLITDYLKQGLITPSDLTSTDLIDSNYSYNNSNGKISPGEMVGISLNLFNSANSTMGGVEVLASDWDHARDDKPCRYFKGFEDTWPTVAEGAASATGEPTDNAAEDDAYQGTCKYITKNNAYDETYPVCFMQLREDSATKWVTQQAFRESQGLEESKCLGGTSETRDCYMRALKGADYSFFSKIDGNKTWAQTITQDGQKNLVFSSENLILFEMNPWIPPGTIFNCRFRARFTNCDDCYNRKKVMNSQTVYDDFDDFHYSGAEPFKIINVQFTVTD